MDWIASVRQVVQSVFVRNPRVLGAVSSLLAAVFFSPFLTESIHFVPAAVSGSLNNPVPKILGVLGIAAGEVFLIVLMVLFAGGHEGRILSIGATIVGAVFAVAGSIWVVTLLDPCSNSGSYVSVDCLPVPWWEIYAAVGLTLCSIVLAYAGRQLSHTRL